MNIEGKTAVVTGGASGLGESAVRRLCSLGANVVIADLNDERGQQLEKELGEKRPLRKDRYNIGGVGSGIICSCRE